MAQPVPDLERLLGHPAAPPRGILPAAASLSAGCSRLCGRVRAVRLGLWSARSGVLHASASLREFPAGESVPRGMPPPGFFMLPFIRSVPHIEYHSRPAESRSGDRVGRSEHARSPDSGRKRVQADLGSLHRHLAPRRALPKDVAQETFAAIAPRMHLPGTGRNWCAVTFQWNASLLSYAPSTSKTSMSSDTAIPGDSPSPSCPERSFWGRWCCCRTC